MSRPLGRIDGGSVENGQRYAEPPQAAALGLERLLRRDRLVVTVALLTIIAASWAYLLSGAGTGMSAFEMSSLSLALGGGLSASVGQVMEAMAHPAAWNLGYAFVMFFMWWIMMIAMMLPSAAPMILLHAALHRRGAAWTGLVRGSWSTAAFTLGYLLAWAAFSAVAVLLQWLLERAALLSPTMMRSTSGLLAAALLLLAGLYQLTPIKQACLRHCRGPVYFLTRHWRPGPQGALQMGIRHGLFCLGCCWGLMALLFFGGIMNLYLILALALAVLLEKLLPWGQRLSRITGALFCLLGMALLYKVVA